MYGNCKKCGKYKKLTKHSLIGGHKPPFVFVCEECHREIHGIMKRKTKFGCKIQRGTKNKKRIMRKKGVK